MHLPKLPQLPEPSSGDQAFRAGVRGAPFVSIDQLQAVPVVVSREPGANIQAVGLLSKWPPAQRSRDLHEHYRIGRALRGIAIVLDRWNELPAVLMQTGQILLDSGAEALKRSFAYGYKTLIEDWIDILSTMPPHVRHGEAIDAIRVEVVAFAEKHREWDENEF